jgi:Calcineurin-like phosphoesterase
MNLPACRVLALSAFVVSAASNCSPSQNNIGTGGAAGGLSAPAVTGNAGPAGPGSGGSGSVQCPPCTDTADCATGSTCTQLGSDSYCAPNCVGGTMCSNGRACVTATDISGNQVSVCVPPNSVCSAPIPGGDAGPPSGMCGQYVGPDIAAACASCGANVCQANGCYGGWWCDTTSLKCHAPPANCGSTGSSTSSGSSGSGGAPSGTVNGNGGTVSQLLFSVVGDTRPAVIGDTSGYPTTIIDKIYSDIEARSPRPTFSLSTGDYMFASPNTSQGTAQLTKYLAARNEFSGVFFPAMGNHECTGATASNCGSGATDGITNNYTSFMTQMLGPIGKTSPYYSVNINAIDGTWTSKFVFIAANAWSSAQSSWLSSTLSVATTYTFVIRHESADANTAPGVTPSEQIMAQHPYTLAIVGHTHTYEHPTTREVVIGNGGAPITGGKNYGYGIVEQRSDGAIQVDMFDYTSGAKDSSFEFALHPNGSPAP